MPLRERAVLSETDEFLAVSGGIFRGDGETVLDGPETHVGFLRHFPGLISIVEDLPVQSFHQDIPEFRRGLPRSQTNTSGRDRLFIGHVKHGFPIHKDLEMPALDYQTNGVGALRLKRLAWNVTSDAVFGVPVHPLNGIFTILPTAEIGPVRLFAV